MCWHTNCTQSHFKAQRLKSFLCHFLSSLQYFWLLWGAGWSSATGSWLDLGGGSEFCTCPLSKLPRCGLFPYTVNVSLPCCSILCVCVLMNIYVSLTPRTAYFSLRLRADLKWAKLDEKKAHFVCWCYLCIFMCNKIFYYDIPVLIHVLVDDLHKANFTLLPYFPLAFFMRAYKYAWLSNKINIRNSLL